MFDSVGRSLSLPLAPRLGSLAAAVAQSGAVGLLAAQIGGPPQLPEALDEIEIVLFEMAAPLRPASLPAAAAAAATQRPSAPTRAASPVAAAAPAPAMDPTQAPMADALPPTDADPQSTGGGGVGPPDDGGGGQPPEGPGGGCVGADCGSGGGGPRRTSALSVTRQVQPVFPDAARRLGLTESLCVLDIEVDRRGRPTAVQPTDCPGVFHASAIAAALQWRFSPLVVDGEARAARFELRVRYRLR